MKEFFVIVLDKEKVFAIITLCLALLTALSAATLVATSDIFVRLPDDIREKHGAKMELLSAFNQLFMRSWITSWLILFFVVFWNFGFLRAVGWSLLFFWTGLAAQIAVMLPILVILAFARGHFERHFHEYGTKRPDESDTGPDE